MLAIQIQLHRPFDRHPSDHIYGEPFDSAVDRLIGGESKWSSPRHQQGNPRANVPQHEISIELHEDGPLIDFVLQNLDQIPNYINALASIVSAWAATRALRKKELPPNDFQTKDGTVIKMGDLRIESARTLSAEELADLLRSTAALRIDKPKDKD